MRPDSVDEFEQGESVTDPVFRDKLNAMREIANSVRRIEGSGRLRVSQDADGVAIWLQDDQGNGGAIVDVVTVTVRGTAVGDPPGPGWHGWEEYDGERTSASEGPMMEVNARPHVEDGTQVLMWVTADGRYWFDTSYSTTTTARDPAYPEAAPGLDQGPENADTTSWKRAEQPGTEWGAPSTAWGAQPYVMTRFYRGDLSSNKPPKLFLRRFFNDSTGQNHQIGQEEGYAVGTMISFVSSVWFVDGTMTLYRQKAFVFSTASDSDQTITIGTTLGDTYKVLVSTADTTPDYLYPSLLVGTTWLSRSIINPGANEQMQIDHAGPGPASGSPASYTHLDYDINEANGDTTGLQIYPSHGTTTFDDKGHRVASGTTSNGNWFFIPQVIGDLGDVSSNAPNDGDVLTYDSGVGEWVPQAPSTVGLTAVSVMTNWRLNGTVFEYKFRSIYCVPNGAESAWITATSSHPEAQTLVYDTDYTDPNFKEFKKTVYVFAPGATTSTTVFTTATCGTA